jgi:hypothetical protein
MDYRLLVNVNVNKCKGHNGHDPNIDGLAQNIINNVIDGIENRNRTAFLREGR